MTRGLLLPALLIAFPVFASGRIAGTVVFGGRAPVPKKLRFAEPDCKTWELSGREVLVRISRNAPVTPPPLEPVRVEHRGCRFSAFLQGAVRGQKLLLRNLDPVAHSVHGASMSGKADQTLFEVVQPPRAPDLEKPLGSGDRLKLSCDFHPAVRSYVVLSDHRFFALAAADGSFEINDVPPGHYTVEAWNERRGTLTAEVSVEEGRAVDPKFNFIAK